MRLLSALPIAAAIITKKGDKLWVEAFNERFIDTITNSRDDLKAAPILDTAAQGPIGDFLRAYLADPATAPDAMEREDGGAINQRYFELKLAPLSPRDGENRCLLSLVDQTMERRAQQNMRDQMLMCSLTGLPNRLAFTEAVESLGEDNAIQPGSHAIIVIDLLRFSRINESMGSIVGDELLITVASRLVGALRKGDKLARTGGNEFAILAAIDKGRGDATAAADRIRQVLAEPFALTDLEIHVDTAIGIALTDSDREGEELFRNAQFAVKQAKHAGKPTIYEPAEASAARRRFSIETELRRALERDELKLHYQPLIDLGSGRVSGFEALARWTHEDRGEITPSEFIPVAEESGLILELGRWAMDKAARTLASWDAAEGQELDLTLSVNLSAIQVARDNISDFVGSALKSHKIGGERLTLELTESAIVQDPTRAIKVFESLKALDTNLAMDDFGTGYSSLAYLQRLPIDLLKIDQRFIKGMLSDADSIAIVRAILGLADALGMKTTAEGIESVELATTLATLGCAKGQGFYFSEAVEAKRALAYWRAREEKAAREGKIPLTGTGGMHG
ncbi:putative bifunctional diguanylate cyclase/phosphodiesterase [Sphingomicrobium sediminis]|uniref:Bifunctional diguanylate cyclase/phosphodiesterase n=1 Tax=Sphingomicrobium sediminis TaxID=2950949 RepID=A0A9X2EEG9_9SPHN|nr:bifunctional diguanylate cyclase/phosphodiesterase [Sphingomicrobium sediminis]MCM8556443.1 bifunctional diguanylate cyclase/phosphodiesterase [Sphingomicrobium sediminis]